jgi:Protein of unknown function (DUF4019)
MRKVAVLSLVLFLSITKLAVAQDAEDKARYAAEQWIVLVDDGQYEQSWKESAKSFQAWITADEWQKRAAADREKLGRKLNRKLKDIKESNSAKGRPQGQYIFVKYQSSFEKKKNLVETITTVLEPDGVWRVSGYVFE